MKMTDIFDLPITGREFYNHVSDDNTTAEEDIAIANCINHADALADSLESMLEHEKEMAYSAWDYRDGRAAIFEQSEEFARFNDSFADELAALAAYRGAK